jgi:predicted ABC-type ATPase
VLKGLGFPGTDAERNLEAARIAEQMRIEWIAQRKTFCLESVFSRTEHWLQVIFGALEAGYRVEVYFLCLADPVLNTVRVETRVQRGGHAVPADRIAKRYSGSIQTGLLARGIVHEFWLYDNSVDRVGPRLLGRFVGGKISDVTDEIPAWAVPFFVDGGKSA